MKTYEVCLVSGVLMKRSRKNLEKELFHMFRRGLDDGNSAYLIVYIHDAFEEAPEIKDVFSLVCKKISENNDIYLDYKIVIVEKRGVEFYSCAFLRTCEVE